MIVYPHSSTEDIPFPLRKLNNEASEEDEPTEDTESDEQTETSTREEILPQSGQVPEPGSEEETNDELTAKPRSGSEVQVMIMDSEEEETTTKNKTKTETKPGDPDVNAKVDSDCPQTPPKSGEKCEGDEDLVCPYRKEDCCDNHHHSLIVECRFGHWNYQWSHVPCSKDCNPALQICPEEAPSTGDLCDDEIVEPCEYGEQECCGKQYAETYAVCSNNGGKATLPQWLVTPIETLCTGNGEQK